MVAHESVSSDQRFDKGNPCPICGGWDGQGRGKGARCHGYYSRDRQWAHCARDERAGGLPLHHTTSLYVHKLTGDCRCGVRHDPAPSADRAFPTRDDERGRLGKPTRTYDYRDEAGTLLYQVCRYGEGEGKTFLQRRPDPTASGGWRWQLGDVRRVLYRLPGFLSAARDGWVFLVEGEKDADALAARGTVATCNAGGAGKWRPEYCEALRGRRVAILPDNDKKGRDHAGQAARSLHGIAADVRIVTLPGLPDKGDVSDWLEWGGTPGQLSALVEAAPSWTPTARNTSAPPRQSRIVRAGDGLIAPPDYLIDQMLPRNALAALVAKPASYKSFIAIGMAAAIFTGQPWAGCETERGTVLYLAAEGEAGIRRRLRAWEIAHGGDLRDLLLLPAATNFLDSGESAVLEAEIAALAPAPALIVVDTLNRNFGGGKENDAGDMGRFFAACDRLRINTGACVLIVHHESKAGGYRGSSAFEGFLDTLITASRSGSAVTLECAKQKDDGDFPPIHLAARVFDLGIADRRGRPVTSIVLQPTDAAFADAAKRAATPDRALTTNERAALDALAAAPDRRLTYADWQRACGLARNTFNRAREALIGRGVVTQLPGGGYALTPIVERQLEMPAHCVTKDRTWRWCLPHE